MKPHPFFLIPFTADEPNLLPRGYDLQPTSYEEHVGCSIRITGESKRGSDRL